MRLYLKNLLHLRLYSTNLLYLRTKHDIYGNLYKKWYLWGFVTHSVAFTVHLHNILPNSAIFAESQRVCVVLMKVSEIQTYTLNAHICNIYGRHTFAVISESTISFLHIRMQFQKHINMNSITTVVRVVLHKIKRNIF